MTFEELDARYDNGFDDAVILGVNIDYQSRIATLQLSLRGNSAESINADVYDEATLTLRNFFYFSIDPPDPERLSYPRRAKIVMNGYSEDPGVFPTFERLRPTLTADAFCCRFFVHNWSSFIHVAAENAEFSWTSGKTSDSSS